jgi:hypothetical protein
VKFLDTLGSLTLLKECADEFCAGLDCESDKDGEYTYMWRGDVTQVVYHARCSSNSIRNDPPPPPSSNQK